jgi:hypothetical protein
MKKLIIVAIALMLTSNVAFARYCLPFAISNALIYNGQPSNWRLLDIELGSSPNGYYMVPAMKDAGINYKKVKEVKFPTIVEYRTHAFTIVGEFKDWWIVYDTLCKTRNMKCVRTKEEVKKHHLKYYYVY